MTRQRYNSQDGLLTSILLTAGTTMTDSTRLPALPAVTGTDIVVVILNPDEKQTGAPEIVYITAHTASAPTATVLRAQEGTTAVDWPVGTKWEHGPTVLDWTTGLVDGATIVSTSGGIGIPAGGVGTSQLAANAVTEAKLPAGAMVVYHFGSPALRDAALPSPVTGQLIYLTTLLGIQQYNGVAWRPPWNMPWGIVTPPIYTAAGVTSASTSFVDLSAGGASFTAVAGRTYSIEATSALVGSTVAGDVVELELNDGTQLILTRALCATTGNSAASLTFDYSPLAGSVNIKFNARRLSGTGTWTVSRVRLVVKDVGSLSAVS